MLTLIACGLDVAIHAKPSLNLDSILSVCGLCVSPPPSFNNSLERITLPIRKTVVNDDTACSIAQYTALAVQLAVDSVCFNDRPDSML